MLILAAAVVVLIAIVGYQAHKLSIATYQRDLALADMYDAIEETEFLKSVIFEITDIDLS